MRQRFHLTMLAILFTCSVHAMGIYKTVGPDGKVTYSDQPPATADARDNSLASSANTVGAAANTSSQKSATRAQQTAGPSGDTALLPVAAITAPVSAASPQESAIIGVLSVEDIVRQTEDMCNQTQPSASAKYSDAASEWRRRNRVPVMQAHHAVAQAFNNVNGAVSEQRIENAIRVKSHGILHPILQAPTTEKLRWCDNAVDQMRGGALDVADKPTLTEPLRSYR
jgi:cell pole-organizing protein PopZ